MSALDDLCIDGYRRAFVSCGFVAPFRNETVGNQDFTRDLDLSGVQIHLYLNPQNRVATDPGYWYVVQCSRAQEGHGARLDINIRRMHPDGSVVEEVDAPLDDANRATLLDCLQGQILDWHAQKCGPGPFDAAPAERANE